MQQYGLTFEVPFVAGKARPRFTMRGTTYTRPEDTERMEAIENAFLDEMQKNGFRDLFPVPADTDVSVFISCFKPLAKRTPKKVESEPFVQKPDVDNIAKLVLDALNGMAYEDDKQVTQLHISKADRRRDQEEGMMVSIRWQIN